MTLNETASLLALVNEAQGRMLRREIEANEKVLRTCVAAMAAVTIIGTAATLIAVVS